MKVYHFIEERYGLEDLREERLKISLIDELNDPFEFVGVDLSNPDHYGAIKELKRGISENYGIICFSASWNDPVQWAHYADGHKGLCMGFDVPYGLLKK